MYKRADIYLMKVDFVFEFPRPTMPNAIYIGGFQFSLPYLNLSPRIFNNSWTVPGKEFSLGTIVNKLPLHIAREIVAGLAHLKEQVIWRYPREPLDTLGNNTTAVDWLPQIDLLSRPNTKMFLSHGGENGVYEAFYHCVPIVGFPLCGSQHENLLRLKMKGAAVLLVDTQDITAQDIFNAVCTAIDDPSYSRVMNHLSGFHQSAPIPPRVLAVFWTEFVLHHKGTHHLQLMTWLAGLVPVLSARCHRHTPHHSLSFFACNHKNPSIIYKDILVPEEDLKA